MLSTLSLLRLLSAIAVVESNSTDSKVGDHGDAIGRYQIHSSVVVDVNRHYGTSYNWVQMTDPVVAEWVAILYLRIYTYPYLVVDDGSLYGTLRNATLEDAARIWNGGPDGWKEKATEKYWTKVHTELARQFWSTVGDRIGDPQNFREWLGLDSHDTMGAWPLPPSNLSPDVLLRSIRGINGKFSAPLVPATSSSSASSGSAATGIPSISFRSTIKPKGARRARPRASRSPTSPPARTP